VLKDRLLRRVWENNEEPTLFWSKAKELFMKRTIVSAFFFWLVLTAVGFAHAPTKIFVNYDDDAKILVVWVTHDVSLLKQDIDHYVKDVKIFQNNAEVVEIENLAERPDYQYGSSFAVYLKLREGDSLEIQAFCAKEGSLNKKMVVDKAFMQEGGAQ
jgi:hypothetical protein